MDDINEIFPGYEMGSDGLVGDESMLRFVDNIIAEIKDSLIAKDLREPPVTIYVAALCTECDELHLIGSKLIAKGEDGEEIVLDGALPTDEMSEHAETIGRTLVGVGFMPVVAAIVLPAFFHADALPPDYHNWEELEDDELLQEQLVKTYKKRIKQYKNGKDIDKVGEAAVVQALCVDGSICAGFVNLERDSLGYVRPTTYLKGIDAEIGSDSSAGMEITDVGISAVIGLFNGARKAVDQALAGKPVEIDDEVIFKHRDNDAPII